MQPITPDAHGIAVLILTVVALFLFTRDNIPLESSSLAILIILVTGFTLFPYVKDGDVALSAVDFFAGFGNEALVAICALMMVGKALETTGALQPLATVVSRAWASRPVLALVTTLIAGAILSAFMNNTPIVVLLMPILVGASLRAKFPVSGVMMPMGLATIIGGMSTTIGTSTNLLVVGIAHDMGQHDFTMFEWVLPVAIVGGVGILFLWMVAPRMLPDRTPPMADTTPRIFTAQLNVKEGGFADGKTLSEVLAKDSNLRIDKIQRSETLFLAKLPSVTIQAGDRLFVKDSPENLKHYESLLGATLFNELDDEHPIDEDTPLQAEGQQLAEVVVTRGSPLHLRSLAAARFTASYGLMPLALHRARAPSSQVTGDLNMIRMRAGDVLLVQGTKEAVQNLRDSGTMLVLDGTTDLPQTHHAKRALFIMGLVVAAAAFGVMPISVAAVAGLGAMLVTGCLNWREAAGALSIPVVMIIVTALALGSALMGTGMADYIANSFVAAASGLPIAVILSLFMLLMTIMTNIVSNNAAAAIGTPIAISIATQLGVEDPTPFILAVLFGANMSFATPYGYQTNLLVMSAGGYKFSDFLRVGIPLTVIMWIGSAPAASRQFRQPVT
ncbi:MAG: SLC13 family permease, partial [Pseudomonadota bacterium]